MSIEQLKTALTVTGIAFILAGIVALFFYGDAGAVPTSRYTKVITHDSSYAIQGARAKRSYSDSLDKSDSVFTRSLKISGTGRGDSLSSRAALITDLLESGYLQVAPDAVQLLEVTGDNLLHFNSVSGSFNTGSFFDKSRLWVESSNPNSKFKIEVDSSDQATSILSTGNYLLVAQDTSFGLKIFPRAAGIAGGMFLGVNSPAHSTARLQIEGGTGALGTVPLQLLPGPLSGFKVSGGIENTGRHFYGTDTIAGGTLSQRQFIQNGDSATIPLLNSDSIEVRAVNSFKYQGVRYKCDGGGGGTYEIIGLGNRQVIDVVGETEYFQNTQVLFTTLAPWAGHGPSMKFGRARTGVPGRGAISFEHPGHGDDYVNIVMDPFLATVPEDGGIEYDLSQFWGTSTAKGRRPFVQQGDTITAGKITVNGYNLAPSYSELWVDTSGLSRVLPSANVFYGVKPGHAGLTTSGIVQDTADTSGCKLIFGSGSQGIYRVSYSASYKHSATDTLYFTVFKNSVEQPNIGGKTFFSAAASLVDQGGSGLVSISINDTLRLKVSCSNSTGHSILINHYNLNASRIGN